MTRRPPRHRVGSTYVLVLLVSAMVVTIGLSSMTVARLGHEETVGMGDVIAAHSVAIAGIEHAHHEIMLAIDSVSSSPTDWRTVVTDLPHGPFTVGGGSFTWVISDPTDDDLTDDTRDPVAVTVTAQSGTSTEIVRFTLAPGPGAAGLSCLQSALHAGGQVNFDGAFLSSDGVLSTNADFVANADIYASVEASGTVTGSTYHQPTLAGAASRDLPGTSALEYYLAHGTYLPMSAMEHVGSTDQHSDLQDLVLTPTLNPFGPPNPEGIY
ncbi:MAG: hypothetical protein HKO59_00715, partial [Phycisphaerales bacterium]|nr:hypothetical protein [Phycisphaerales bacterium]